MSTPRHDQPEIIDTQSGLGASESSVKKAGSPRRLLGVVVTFRRPEPLRETLAGIATDQRGVDQLVVVDNDQSTGSRSIVAEFESEIPGLVYVGSEENLGPAGGFALGTKVLLESAADDDWIVTFGDDNPPPAWNAILELEAFAGRMVERDGRTASVGLVGARFDATRGELLRVHDAALTGPIPVDYLGSGHLAMHRVGALRIVGTFAKELFFSYEELELGLRLRDAGYSLYAHGELWRDRRRSDGRVGLRTTRSGRFQEPPWRRYYSIRNMIYILRQRGRRTAAVRVSLGPGLAKPLANLVISPRAALTQVALSWQACVDGWTGRLGRRIDPDVPWAAGYRPPVAVETSEDS